MDKTAPKRSAPRSAEYGEPESKKRATGTPRKSSDGKESSNRDCESPETGRSLISPEPCTIQQLPQEVLAKIFSYSSSIPCHDAWKSSSLRLVCKNWDDVYIHYTDAKLYFRKSVPSVLFENCGLIRRRLDIEFCYVDLSKLPQSMWQKIGCRVRSLKLMFCKVGDHGWKNLIMHCPNLRFLKVLHDGDVDARDLFCSPNMLKKLDITRENLESFEITSRQQSTVDVANWIEIFEAFFKVFPNVTRYSAGCIRSHIETFKFDFLKEADEKNFNAIATSLALSLSTDVNDQRKAIDIASTLRLKDISLRQIRSAAEEADKDVSTLVNFFRHCINLECIAIDINWEISDTMLKSFLLQIVGHCCKLRKLRFCSNSEFIFDLAETLLLELRTMYPSLEELCIHPFTLDLKHSSMTFDTSAEISSRSEKFLNNAMLTYPDIQHLDLENSDCTDELLRSIFKHLPNLKTLIVELGKWNTNAGIASPGDSIDRLKSLEKLALRGYYDSQLEDTIFDKLNFPNLRHFEIDLRKDPLKLLRTIAQSMPSLETIHFTNSFDIYPCPPEISKKVWSESMVLFVRQLKKLRIMKLRHSILGSNGSLTSRNISTLFLASSSLHCIEGHIGTRAHYLRDSNKIVMMLDGKGGLNITEQCANTNTETILEITSICSSVYNWDFRGSSRL